MSAAAGARGLDSGGPGAAPRYQNRRRPGRGLHAPQALRRAPAAARRLEAAMRGGERAAGGWGGTGPAPSPGAPSRPAADLPSGPCPSWPSRPARLPLGSPEGSGHSRRN